MTFLNTAFLFFLSAASLPLIIHLFTRSKNKTIRFSTLDFLKELENKQIRRLKLRQLLLLILRFLIIVLLVLAFARPTLKGNLTGVLSPNAKTTAAIILDNSVSMRVQNKGSSSIERARTKIKELLDAVNPNDDIYLLSAADATLPEMATRFQNSAQVAKAVDATGINYRKSDLSKTLSMAARLLQGSQNINKEIFLFSDLQQSAISDDSLRLTDSKNFAIPIVAKQYQNLSISRTSIGSAILEKGKVIDLRAEINNYGDKAVGNKLVQLFVDGKPVSQNMVLLQPHSQTVESFKFVLNSTGMMSGYFMLEQDDLMEDNKRYFTIFVPEKIRVGLVGLPQDIRYVSLALRPAPSQQLFDVTETSPARLRFTSFHDFDVVVLSNTEGLDPETLERLAEFISSGGGLLFIAGQNLDVQAFNRQIAPRFNLPAFIETLGAIESTSSFSIDDMDISHPLFYGVFETRDLHISEPNVRFALRTDKNTAVQEIIRYSSGDPFLYEKSLPSGRLLVMTTGLNMQVTDLPHKTLFSPLITRAISYLAAPRQALEKIIVGDELRFQLSPKQLKSTLTIERPDGRIDQLHPTILTTGPWVVYQNSDWPGIYKLSADGKTVYQWAVNIPAEEFDLAPMTEKELEKKLSLNVINKDVDFKQLIRQSRYGTELWKYFVIGAFILLIVEMLLYRQKEQ